MKLIVLIMTVGCMLAAGCVATTIKTNDTPLSPPSDAGLNKTVNATANSSSALKGSLSVSITGFSDPANLSVILDNETVGTVNPTTPLNLKVSEGNHTVMVCVDPVCVQENVTTRFGRYQNIDFSERLHKAVANARPTVRIIGCYRNGNAISIDVEFINPSKKDLFMSVAVSCGYSYIDDRTSIRMGDSARGRVVQNVGAGQRITKGLDLHFANGNSISYSFPVIEELTIQ
jgi:hypothetical protein